MDIIEKKRRDTSRQAAERRAGQSVTALVPAIATLNDALARYRAIAGLARPGYAEQVRPECHRLREKVTEHRLQLNQIAATLPAGQRDHGRLRDMRLALDKLDAGLDALLETLAAARSDGVTIHSRIASGVPPGESPQPPDRQGGAETQ
jgi:hypothetical protein